MNQKLRNSLWAAGIFLLPAIGYSQQLGGTAPDPKMLPGGGNTGSAMGSIYAPNLYDGTVNVTVPIYQYSNDAGNFGISLTYNTKGVPVDEISSAVGLHWNIAAEGSIRRTVKGLPDEFNVPNVPDSIYEDVDTRYYAFKGRLAASFENTTQAADPEVFRDGEGDDFEVSAGGLSFRFNIGRDRSIFVNPDKNIKVEILSNGVPYANVASSNPNFYDPLSLEFRVTDLQGNQYYFKRGTYDNNVMYAETDASALPNSIATYNLVSRWVLSEVTLAGGGRIRYNYKYGGRDERTYQSYSATDVFWIPMGSSVENKNNSTCELSSIEYPNGVTARFVYDTLNKRLDFMENPAYPAPDPGQLEGALREVRIESGNNCLRYKMDQSYTVAKGYDNQTITEVPYNGPFTVITDTWSSPHMNIIGQRSHRLRLNGISLLSCDGTKEEPYYSFSYENNITLPCRFNSGQDYFGYYNGKQNATKYPNQDYPDVNLTIPNHVSAVAGNSFSYGADRSEDATKIKASILTEIKNAYGGKVAFEYEGHGSALEIPLQGLPADNYFLGETTADGLRIRTITETDPYYPANAKITSFTYNGGQLFLAGGYYHAPKVMTTISPSSPEFGIGIWTGNLVTPHQMVNGSSHGYSQVTVVTKDNNNSLLSKKEILFTNFKDATSNNLPRYTRTAGSKHYYEFPFTDKQYLRDWEMGLPLQITDYDENGRITSRTVNSYTFSIDTTTSVTKKADGAKASYVKDPNKPPFPAEYLWTPKTAIPDPYKPFTGKALLARTVIQKYISDATYISDTVQYVYDSRSNLSSIVAYNSKGEATATKHVYNYDIPINVGTVLSGLEKIVSTQRWKRRPAQQDSILLDAFFNRYTNQLSGSQPVNIWSKSMYSLVAGSPLTIAQYNGTGPYNNTALKAWAAHNGNAITDFRKATEVILYDTKGNPLETRILDQDQYKAMIWDTLTGQKIAEASNCHYNDIAFTSFEATNKGNFIYETAGVEAAPVPTAGPLSGQKMYAMNSFRPTVGMSGLNPAKTYMLTFWAKDGVPSFSGPGIASLTFTAQAQRSGWTFYAAKFTPQTSGTYNIQYNGTPIYLDEIRLFPANAAMQSMTYIPLFGQGSVTDATGRITTYSYDMLGRLAVVRDQEGNIISKTQYAVHEAE